MKFFARAQTGDGVDASHAAMRHLLAIGLTTLTLLPAVAFAEAPARSELRVESFEDELVSGDLLGPDTEVLNIRQRGPRRSLIRAREHFTPEMMRSVERL